MSLIETNITVDKGFFENILKFLKDFANLPRWLLIVFIFSMLISIGYFFYTRNDYLETIAILQEQINQLSLIVAGNINLDDYSKNLVNVITEMRLLKHIQELNSNDDINTIETLELYVLRISPNDPIIRDLEAIKARKKLNLLNFNEEYDFILNSLKKFIELNKHIDEQTPKNLDNALKK